MRALFYIRKMAAIGEAAQVQVMAVLHQAAKNPLVSSGDFEALCYAARSVFFPTLEDVERR